MIIRFWLTIFFPNIMRSTLYIFWDLHWPLKIWDYHEITFKTIQVQLNLFGWIITLEDVLRVYCMMKLFWAEKKNQFCTWVHAWDYFCIYLSFFICVIGWAYQGFQSINIPYFVKYFKYIPEQYYHYFLHISITFKNIILDTNLCMVVNYTSYQGIEEFTKEHNVLYI